MDTNLALKYSKKKKKRKRTVITPEVLDRLENEFEKEHRPDRLVKLELADELGVSETVVCTWFQNRRARAKKEGRKEGPVFKKETPLEQSQPINLSTRNVEETERKYEETSQYSLFGRLVRMAAAAEGCMMTPSTEAMSDARDGIPLVEKNHRLVYHLTYGFDFEEVKEHSG